MLISLILVEIFSINTLDLILILFSLYRCPFRYELWAHHEAAVNFSQIEPIVLPSWNNLDVILRFLFIYWRYKALENIALVPEQKLLID